MTSISINFYRISLTILLFAGTVLITPVQAAQAIYEKFFGEYHGKVDFEHKGQSQHRDLSVSIKPKGDAFNVTWITTTYKTDATEAEKSYTIDFQTSEQENIFGAAMKTNLFGGREPLDPLKGDPYVWARIVDDTLSVFALHVTGEGGYEIQVYDRTLTAQGLDLVFSRIRDGETLKEIHAELTRQ